MIGKERLVAQAPKVSRAGVCLLRRRVDQRNVESIAVGIDDPVVAATRRMAAARALA